MRDIDRIADGTGAGIAIAYRSGETDPVAIAECLLDRIDKTKADNIFITVTAARALTEAKASAARYRSGTQLSPLDGVPIAWKDNIDIAGAPTTAGSRHFSKGPIKSSDQICAANAAAQGLVTVGKLNMSELAYSGLGLNPHFGTPRNPNDRSILRAPGGSSSGCGAAVAARLVPCAIGTDTGGSVRIPAAFNGVIGYKTSYGRLDTTGVIPLARSYDTIGPLARSVEDCILLGEALRGAVSIGSGRALLRDLTIVVPENIVTTAAEDAVVANFERTLEILAGCGVTIRRESLDALDEISDVTARYGTLTAAEAYFEYRDIVDGDAVRELDRRVVHRILLGKSMSANDVIAIQRARERLIPDFARRLSGVLLAMPTSPITAPEVALLESSDELFHEINLLTVRNTMFGNILDLCAVALPNGHNAEGLPTSFLLSGPNGADERLLAAAGEIERIVSQTRA
jgi:aspartyl-tRNA(Asn)/glutamyl-tRNA(Gln) amidotransferase subunit A